MSRAEFERLYTTSSAKLTDAERAQLNAELMKWSDEYKRRGCPSHFGPFDYAQEFLK